jgi:predicted RNA-binding Zn ribbon-like protein
VPRLSAAGSRRWVPPVTVEAALSTIAREAIEVLTGPLADRLKECASDDCPLFFVDGSRSAARRWCSMARCGNRHKIRAFRDRSGPS